MIRFACAKCGKIHRVPDHYAGRRGKCGRCGLRFVAPGTTPSTSNVFVPADSDSDQFNVQLTDHPTRGRSGVTKTISLGLLIGLAMMSCLFLLRDGIVSNAPGLAPMMPPKAAPARRAPVPQPQAGLTFDSPATARLAVVLIGLAHLLILVVMPLAVPPIVSRCQLLSVGRWLIMAAVSGFFAISLFLARLVFSGLGVLTLAEAARQGLATQPLGALGMLLATIGFYTFVYSFFGIPGCLIAAAVHPKDPPQP